jgi:hypothetical protein
VVVGSRLLPLVLALATLAAAAVGLSGLALWLGLALVVAAAAAAFVAVSDTLEGRPALLLAVTNGIALAFVVLGSAARMNGPSGGAVPPLATYAVVAALAAYALPAVWWVLEPLRVTRRTPARRRLRPAEVDELLSRAA